MDEGLGLALGDVGLRSVVFDEDLQRAAADATAFVDALFREQDAVALRTAEPRTGPGQRQHRPDLDRFARRLLLPFDTRMKRQQQQRPSEYLHEYPHHG